MGTKIASQIMRANRMIKGIFFINFTKNTYEFDKIEELSRF